MDPIADFLNSLKMASRTNKESFVFPASGIVMDIASVLVKSGYLSSVRKIKKGREIRMTLPVSSRTPSITSTKRVSRLSKRIYRRARDIRPVRNGSGTAVSTRSSSTMKRR